jgi:hypothetical protein
MRRLAIAASAAIAGAAGYPLVVSGQLTLDTGVGRRVRPLGPLTFQIAADRETVFEVIAAPYLGRTPRALSGEIEVLERGSDMVLAAHRTPVAFGLVATTVETVRFDRPHTVDFRLARGPVPHVLEQFTLHDESGSTRLDYSGELGTDFWSIGTSWAAVVSRSWVSTVQRSLERIGAEAERRAAARRR